MNTSIFIFLLSGYVALAQIPCEQLRSQSLANTTITAAEVVAAKRFLSLPATVPCGPYPRDCRVAALLTPSARIRTGNSRKRRALTRLKMALSVSIDAQRQREHGDHFEARAVAQHAQAVTYARPGTHAPISLESQTRKWYLHLAGLTTEENGWSCRLAGHADSAPWCDAGSTERCLN